MQPDAMRNLKTVIVLSLLIGPIAGCNSDAQKYAERAQLEATRQAEQQTIVRLAEERLKQEEARRLAELKRQVRENPLNFIESSDFGIFDKGIINTYRQLVKVTLLNKSSFALTDLRGEVEWFADNGDQAGSTMFRLKGSLPAGDSKTFSTDGGTLSTATIETHANKLRLKFAPAKIVE